MTTKNSVTPSLLNRTDSSTHASTHSVIRGTILLPIFGLACLIFIYLFDTNQSFFLYLNAVSGSTGEFIWATITLFGDPIILLCLALSLHAAAPQISFAILPTLLFGGSTVMYLKWFFAVVRPPGVLHDIVIIGNPPISGAFPSGHATGAFALATLLMLLTPNRYFKLILFVLALLVGISRIAVGAHWPLDVSAGIILGWLSAIVGVKISKNWQQSKKKTQLINILLLLTSLYLFFRNTGYTQAQLMQFIIAISCCATAVVALIKSNRI